MQKHNAVTISGSQLPESVRNLYKPPAELHCLGDTSLLSTGKRVGIVGARKFTPYGREVTAELSRTLAQSGVTIVSGLALGVDSIAHRACLEVSGATIAILPSGIDKIYPANHAQLASQIAEQGGLLVSEYAGSALPMKHQFIERNRIIAALSDILVVTEAAQASGSLHTARFALEQGVTVMAVPGPITSPYSIGSNQLIKHGAIPILSAQDILDELGISARDTIEYLPENELEEHILQRIADNQTLTNQIIADTKHPPHLIQTHITMLEIKGIIEAQSGHWSIR